MSESEQKDTNAAVIIYYTDGTQDSIKMSNKISGDQIRKLFFDGREITLIKTDEKESYFAHRDQHDITLMPNPLMPDINGIIVVIPLQMMIKPKKQPKLKESETTQYEVVIRGGKKTIVDKLCENCGLVLIPRVDKYCPECRYNITKERQQKDWAKNGKQRRAKCNARKRGISAPNIEYFI